MKSHARTPLVDVPPPSNQQKHGIGHAQCAWKLQFSGLRLDSAVRDPYHPIVHSDVTKSMERATPCSNINSDRPTFHRRQTSITGAVDARPHIRRQEGSPPETMQWFGRSSTDVSEHLYKARPPRFGLIDSLRPIYNKTLGAQDIKRTIPPMQENRPPVPTINHWWRDRSGADPSCLTVPPQYVSTEDLYAALSQRRQDVPGPRSVDEGAEFHQLSLVDIPIPSQSAIGTPKSVIDTNTDLKCASSKKSDICETRQSIESVPRGRGRESRRSTVPSRTPLSRSKTREPESLELVRPRFTAGGVVRPFTPQQPMRSGRRFTPSRLSSILSRPSSAPPSPREPVPVTRVSAASTPDRGLLYQGPASFVQHTRPWRG